MRGLSSTSRSSFSQPPGGTPRYWEERPQAGGWPTDVDHTPPEPPSRMHAVNEMLWGRHVPLIALIMVTSICGFLMTDMPGDTLFPWTWRWLGVPVLLGGWLYAWTQRHYFLEHQGVPWGHFLCCAVASPPMLLLFSAGMAALLNASHEGEPVRFEGPITRMESPRGKSNDYLITVQDEATQREVTFATDVHTYPP